MKFRLVRWTIFAGFILIGLAILVTIIHDQATGYSNLSVFLAWLVALAILIAGFIQYRCPFCGAFPEDDDVPLFNPIRCCECDAQLRP